jgi:hypothetical protein
MRATSCLVLVLAGCQDFSVERQAIVGGQPSDASDDEVVLILTHVPEKDTAQGQFYLNCTGTLLAPNLVLTARHCVSRTSDGTFVCDQNGQVTSGSGGQVTTDFLPADTHVFVGPTLPATVDPTQFPGQATAYVHDAGTVTCNDDLALIVLDKPIDNAKLAPIRLDGPVTADETLSVVGWGATETRFLPSTRQRRDGVGVVDIGPSSTFRIGGQLANREWLATESVCQGDSGGPAFDSVTGAVVGTVSRGSNGGISTNGSGCVGTQHTFMQTGSFKDLIMMGFTKAGASPLPEMQPAPPDMARPAAPKSSGCDILPHPSGAGWMGLLMLLFWFRRKCC